jgi:hypothetical protein
MDINIRGQMNRGVVFQLLQQQQQQQQQSKKTSQT